MQSIIWLIYEPFKSWEPHVQNNISHNICELYCLNTVLTIYIILHTLSTILHTNPNLTFKSKKNIYITFTYEDVPTGRFCAVCITSGGNFVPTVKPHTHTAAVLVTRTKLEQDERKWTQEGFRLSLTSQKSSRRGRYRQTGRAWLINTKQEASEKKREYLCLCALLSETASCSDRPTWELYRLKSSSFLAVCVQKKVVKRMHVKYVPCTVICK